MTGEIAVCGRDDQVDVAVQAAAGIPAGIKRPHRVRADHQLVGLAVLHLVGDIDLEAQVAIVRTADALAVEIHVADQHNSLEIKRKALSLQVRGNLQGLAIPARAELLEGPGGQGAAEVRGEVRHITRLPCRGRHPGLGNLEIVREIDSLPAHVLFAIVELPAGIEAQGVADDVRAGGRGAEKRGGRQQEEYSFNHIGLIIYLSVRSQPSSSAIHSRLNAKLSWKPQPWPPVG